MKAKPLLYLTRKEREALEGALTKALEGVGDHTQVHEEHIALPHRQAVAMQRRHPMTEEEAKGVEEVRRLRRAGLVLP